MICSKCKELTKEVSEWKDRFDAVSIELIKKCFEVNDLKVLRRALRLTCSDCQWCIKQAEKELKNE